MVELHGMTWSHTRGIAPLRAASEGFRQTYPDVSIYWDARSLQEFEETSVADLAGRYDLLMIDHPFVGLAAASGALIPLDDVLSSSFLDDQAANSVGRSHRSYQRAGHQWAVATDAAAQVAAYRPDLLDSLGEAVPRSWDDVLELARRPGHPVAIPLNPTHLFCSFLALCANLNVGDEDADGVGDWRWPGATGFDEQLAVKALDSLYCLVKLVHPLSLDADPIRVLDTMAGTNEIVYTPLCFGYSNYARNGYARAVVRFTDIPSCTSGPVGAVLGGVGMAISRRCTAVDVATSFVAFTNSPESQRGRYFSSGGQPGHRTAWTDREVNDRASNFFVDTLKTLDLAMLRPQMPGYPKYQREAGQVMHALFRTGTPSAQIVRELNSLWSVSDDCSSSILGDN